MGSVKFRASGLPVSRDKREYDESSRPLYVPILSAAAAFLMLFAIISADVMYGQRFSVLLFYLVPVAWAAWQSGVLLSIIITVFSVMGRFGVEIVESMNNGRSRPELFWGIGTELTFFLVFTTLIIKMHQQLDRERELARSDNLTRLLNARAFEEALELERERLRRYRHALTLVYLDLDNFKTVNDRWGHAAGDELLKTIARTLVGNIREVDSAARLGGDEFAVLLPETGVQGAQIVLERLQTKMLAAVEARGWPVTCSIGSVTFLEAPETIEGMVQQADAAMYSAKKSGKNRIEVVIYGSRTTA